MQDPNAMSVPAEQQSLATQIASRGGLLKHKFAKGGPMKKMTAAQIAAERRKKQEEARRIKEILNKQNENNAAPAGEIPVDKSNGTGEAVIRKKPRNNYELYKPNFADTSEEEDRLNEEQRKKVLDELFPEAKYARNNFASEPETYEDIYKEGMSPKDFHDDDEEEDEEEEYQRPEQNNKKNKSIATEPITDSPKAIDDSTPTPTETHSEPLDKGSDDDTHTPGSSTPANTNSPANTPNSNNSKPVNTNASKPVTPSTLTANSSAPNGKNNDDDAEVALDRARQLAKDYRLREHYNNSRARYMPLATSLYGLVDKGKFINPYKYTRYNEEAARRLHDDPKLVSGYQRSKLINPDVLANQIRATGATSMANAARVSGGNASLAAAASLSAGNNTSSQLGNAYMQARAANNQSRIADNQFNKDIAATNANYINTINATNDKIRTDLTGNTRDTVASADQTNKIRRLKAIDDFAKNWGNFGNDEMQNARTANLATHGIIGQGYSTESQTLDYINGKKPIQRTQANGGALATRLAGKKLFTR